MAKIKFELDPITNTSGEVVDYKAAEFEEGDDGVFRRTGRSFAQDSDYVQRVMGSFDSGVSQPQQTLSINRDYGKLGTDYESARYDQYTEAFESDYKTKNERLLEEADPTKFDETSAQYGAYSFAGMDTLPGEISGQEKAQKYKSLYEQQFARPETPEQTFQDFGYKPSSAPKFEEGMSSQDYQISLARWQAQESEKKAAAAFTYAQETQKDIQERWAAQQNKQYMEDLARGIGDYENDIKNDPNSQSNKTYMEDMSKLDKEKAEAYAKVEEELKGLDPAQRKIYEKFRKGLIDDKYDEQKKQVDDNLKENIKNESQSAYDRTQARIDAYRPMTEQERLNAQKDAAINERAAELQMEWNAEHPDDPLEDYEAKQMATDEFNAWDPEERRAVQSMNRLVAAGQFKKGGDLVGQEVAQGMIKFGNEDAVRKYWNGKVPDAVINKQMKEYWSERYGDTIATEKETRYSIKKTMQSLFDKDVTMGNAEEQLMADKSLEEYKANNPKDYHVALNMAVNDALGRTYTAQDIKQWERDYDLDPYTKEQRETTSKEEKLELQSLIDTYMPDIENEKMIWEGVPVGDADDQSLSFLDGTDMAKFFTVSGGKRYFKVPADMRAGVIEAYRNKNKGSSTTSTASGSEDMYDPRFQSGVIDAAEAINADVDDLMTVIGAETAHTFSPSIKNPKSSATGYIQFIEDVAKGMGTTTKELSEMEPDKQMEYVKRYLSDRMDTTKKNTIEDIYIAIAAPKFAGMSDDTVAYARGSDGWSKNEGWQPANGGDITVGDIKGYARTMRRYKLPTKSSILKGSATPEKSENASDRSTELNTTNSWLEQYKKERGAN